MAKQTTDTPTAPIVGTGAAAPTAQVGVVHSMEDMHRGIASGRILTGLGDDSDEARVRRLTDRFPTDAALFHRDPASGKLLKLRLLDEAKYAYVRKCIVSGQLFVVRTSDVHQTRYARGFKPTGAKANGAAMPQAPAGALKGL